MGKSKKELKREIKAWQSSRELAVSECQRLLSEIRRLHVEKRELEEELDTIKLDVKSAIDCADEIASVLHRHDSKYTYSSYDDGKIDVTHIGINPEWLGDISVEED